MIDKKRVTIMFIVIVLFALVCVFFGKVDHNNKHNKSKSDEFIFSSECKGKEINFIDKLKN